MVVNTNSPRVEKVRATNLELIFAEHIEKCADCIWRFECKLLAYAQDYKLVITTFPDRKSKRETYRFANAVELDSSQCIDCRNCVAACSELQKIDYLEIAGKGCKQEIKPSKKKDAHCILCGQCAVHCPVSAAQEQSDWHVVERLLEDKSKVVVAQFAPSIRVSIGEDFGIPHGEIVTGQIVEGLKKLGFDYVFDTNFGADITTMVEAKELVERLLSDNPVLPMMTSCCPAWVNYIEFYYPELIPNLTTSRSPQIHLGGLIKTYWAKKNKVKPEDIVVVSIMPCTAKKYEASREEMKVDGVFPVDLVLTTREFSFMLKKHNFDLSQLEAREADNPLGSYSGAAAIYGASGGVMESALRTAHYMVCQVKGVSGGVCKERVEFKSARGMEGVKEAMVEVGGKKLRIAVVNGIGNIAPVIENLDRYRYVEVMSCPGGCIGGGGQPIPTTDEIRKKRIAALYSHDKNLPVRLAHKNVDVLKALDWLDDQGEKYEHGVLHTSYKEKKRY